jgi:hypothetical protein
VIGILPLAVEGSHWPDPASQGLVLDNLGHINKVNVQIVTCTMPF